MFVVLLALVLCVVAWQAGSLRYMQRRRFAVSERPPGAAGLGGCVIIAARAGRRVRSV